MRNFFFQLNYQRDQVAAIKDKQQEKEQTDDREHSQVHSWPRLLKSGYTIHRINQYPEDNIVCFVNTYPLDSDLTLVGGVLFRNFENIP